MKSVILKRILSLFTYYSPSTTIFLVLLCIYIVTYKLRRWRIETLLDKIPGPKPLPIIGNILEITTGFEGEFYFQALWCLNSLGLFFFFQYKFDHLSLGKNVHLCSVFDISNVIFIFGIKIKLLMTFLFTYNNIVIYNFVFCFFDCNSLETRLSVIFQQKGNVLVQVQSDMLFIYWPAGLIFVKYKNEKKKNQLKLKNGKWFQSRSFRFLPLLNAQYYSLHRNGNIF